MIDVFLWRYPAKWTFVPRQAVWFGKPFYGRNSIMADLNAIDLLLKEE